MHMRRASSCTCDSDVRHQVLHHLRNSTILQPCRLPQVWAFLFPIPIIDYFIIHFTVSGDLVRSVLSVPQILVDILPSFIPYTLVVAAFAAFVIYNGGIVLGMLFSNEGCFIDPTLEQVTRPITYQRFTYHNCTTLLLSRLHLDGQFSYVIPADLVN
jgi:DIE2/ALG10 family